MGYLTFVTSNKSSCLINYRGETADGFDWLGLVAVVVRRRRDITLYAGVFGNKTILYTGHLTLYVDH